MEDTSSASTSQPSEPLQDPENMQKCVVVLKKVDYEEASGKYLKATSSKGYKRIRVESDSDSDDDHKKQKMSQADPFVIDELDKQTVECSDNDRPIEVFPEMSPYVARDAIQDTENDEDALFIGTDDDFGADFEENDKKSENEPTKSENLDTKDTLERQSILTADDDDSQKADKKDRFGKFGNRRSETKKNPARDNVRFVSYNKNNNNKRAKPAAIASPWAFMPNLPPPRHVMPFQPPWTLPFTTLNLPPPPAPNKTASGQKLFTEFSKICRDQLYGTCNGNNMHCNGNHTLPDPKWVQFMLSQMNINEVLKFVTSCYKSLHCSLIYFNVISTYFGDKKMKNHLLEAIPMAESTDLLLQNYKWIVDGLIRAGDTPTTAIQILLNHRRKWTARANRIVVEIIVKTKLEGSFLGKLVEISQNTREVFDVHMFHRFMVLAMQDPGQIGSWKMLIENILENLRQQNVYEMLDQQLISTFINYLGKEDGSFEN